MKKICFLLCLILLFAAFPVSAAAEEEVQAGYRPEWTPTDSLPPEEVTDILEHTFTAATASSEIGAWYGISNAEGLIKLATLSNGKKASCVQNANFCLTADIDMKGKEYTPIFNGYNMSLTAGIPAAYQGVFDGKGHCIKNLSVDCVSDTVEWGGLFGTLGSQAKVRNLVFDSTCLFSSTKKSEKICIGAVAGRMIEGARIENIYSAAQVSGGQYSGGIVGRLDPAVRNGFSNNTNSISYVTVANSTRSRVNAGGIVGAVFGNVNLSYCRQSGVVYTSMENSNVGGIIGAANEAFFYEGDSFDRENLVSVIQIFNCINLGNLRSTASIGINIGGIVGFVQEDNAQQVDLTMVSCLNQGCCSGTAAMLGKKATVKAAELTNCIEDSAGVRLHGVQFGLPLGEEESFSLRFVGSVKDLEYSEVGFYITLDYNGKHLEKKLSCKTVFTSLSEGETSKSVSDLRGEEGYLYALTVEGIPNALETVTFTVVPYAVRISDGKICTGIEGKMTCKKGTAVQAWEIK